MLDVNVPYFLFQSEKPPATCGCRKFQLDPLGDHLNTCTTHSGAKKAHDWMVDQITDLFLTTHKVKTQQVIKSRGCRDWRQPEVVRWGGTDTWQRQWLTSELVTDVRLRVWENRIPQSLHRRRLVTVTQCWALLPLLVYKFATNDNPFVCKFIKKKQ